MLRKLRKRRRAGWFVVVSYLPRSQRSGKWVCLVASRRDPYVRFVP
jgi:hypothetical protein